MKKMTVLLKMNWLKKMMMNLRNSLDSLSSLRVSKNVISKDQGRQSAAGQIVIEYILLLAIAVSVAMLMTRFLISRTPGEEGLIIRSWQTLSEEIGADLADDLKNTEEQD